MKVLDLQCSQNHSFEGWFASEDEFQSQLARGLVECPLCGDRTVNKMLSAPRLNLGAAQPAPRQEVVSMPDASLQAAWLKMVRHVMANTEDVGERFAEEARSIHYGETEERAHPGPGFPRGDRGPARRGHWRAALAHPEVAQGNEPLGMQRGPQAASRVVSP